MKYRCITLFFLAACVAYPQTAVFPNGVATTPQLMQAGNNLATKLTAPITSSATTVFVQNTTGFTANMLITFSDTSEIAVICQVNTFQQLTIGYNGSCPSTTGRGFDGTTAVSHVATTQVFGYYTAWHHNVESKEITAIESAMPNTVSDIAYSSFQAACSAASGRTLMISKQWTGLATQTCGASLSFVGGGMLQPASLQTVTLARSVTAGQVKIFDVSLGGIIQFSQGAVATVYPQWFGETCDGSTIDDFAINSAISASMNSGSIIYVDCISAVKNIVVPTAKPDSVMTIIFGAGAQWNCHNNDGSDCVAAVSTAFSNPKYTINGMKLVGPDTYGSTTNVCSSITSGHGLRISGAAVPRLILTGYTAYSFCGTGKSGLWLDNVEESLLSATELQFNAIGLKTSNFFNANVVTKMNASQNAAYGVYMTGGSINNTVDSLTAQSNQAQAFYCDGCVADTFTAPHLENNNILASSICTWTFDSATVNTGGNLVDAPQFQGANDQVCMKNTGVGLVNVNTIFRGGVTSSLPRGFDITGAPQQVIDGTISDSVVTGRNGLTGFYPSGNSQYQVAPPCASSTDAAPCYAFADNAGGAGFKSGMRWDGNYLHLVANGTPWVLSPTSLYAPGQITFTNNSFYLQTWNNKWLLYDAASAGAEVSWFDVTNSRQAFRMLPGTGGPNATARNIFTGNLTADKFSTAGPVGEGYTAATLPTINLATGNAVICIDCTAANPTAAGGSPRWVFWTGTQWNGD